MKNHQGKEGSDFFEEIQDKIEQDIFRKPDVDADDAFLLEEAPDHEAGVEEGQVPGLEVQVEIVDSDADTAGPDVDDSFLEEVDVVMEEDHVTSALEETVQQRAGEFTGIDLGVTENTLRDDEPVPFQEDERFLGELIDREMVEKESDATPSLSDLPSLEDVSSPSGMAYEEQEEKDLKTRTLGDLYAEQGHYDQAIEIYEQLLQEKPGDPELQNKLTEYQEKAKASYEIEGVEETFVSKEEMASCQVPRTEVIQCLETWLDRIRAEKERRCLKSS
jgi:tetratricopeptide (TPR) repeat protein